ncbi:RNA-binding protein lark-like [Argonauta hians]
MPRTTKLYVGNLPQGSDENSVRVLFSEFGEVVECDIIKNFGFVHFTDIGDAMKAVDSLNNKEWKGSTLKVQQSHSKVHVKPGMGNRGECIRCGKTGHLCRDCPTVRTLDFKGGDIHEKTCATLSNISKEISATNGSIDGLYSFLGKSRDSWKRDSFNDRDNQSDFIRNWLRNDDNGDSNSRHNNNSRDYRRNMSGSSDRYSNSNQPSRSSLGSESYRHQPYLQAHARRLATIVAAARANLPTPSPSQSSSMMPNDRKIPPRQQQPPPSMQRSRPPSSSSSKPSSMPPPHSRPFSSLPPTPSSAVGRPTNNNNNSSSNNNTNNNLANREMNPNPFFRPPPEYYEQRRRKSQLRSQQH